MKFSNETLNILKNFASINQSLLFKPGNELRTISNTKQVFAVATVTEQFNERAAIWDLPRLLSILTLIDSPDITFGEKQLEIKGNDSIVKYTYAAEHLITHPPEKNIEVEHSYVDFQLSWDIIDRIIKSVAVMRQDVITFECDGEMFFIKTHLKDNPSSDIFKINIKPYDQKFSASFKPENFRMIQSNYGVRVDKRGFMFLDSEKVKYWISAEVA